MTEHSSYHGSIRGREAQYRLREFGTRCYLTRHSHANRSYRLSVYEPETIRNHIRHRIKHFKITVNKWPSIWGLKWKDVYKIKGKEFDSADKMFCYFEKNRIDPVFQDIGKCVTEKEYFELMNTKQQSNFFLMIKY